MSKYNAKRETEQGRLTHDVVERPMHFGPGRDHEGLTAAVRQVVHGGELQRSKKGNSYWMSAEFANAIGIRLIPSEATDPETRIARQAPVHDTLRGVIDYVGASALPADMIVPDLARQLAEVRAPSQEPPRLPAPTASTVPMASTASMAELEPALAA